MSPSRTVAIDFDGVLHRYENGWNGEVPTEEPVDGAREAVARVRASGYRVSVFTCRALTQKGMDATVAWLAHHGIQVDEVTNKKPHAVAYIDDRAVRFEGDWSAALALIGKRPWNARPWTPPAALGPNDTHVLPPDPTCHTCGEVVNAVTPAGTYPTCGHPIPEPVVLTPAGGGA